MSSSRILIVLSVLGAFVGGIAVGMYVTAPLHPGGSSVEIPGQNSSLQEPSKVRTSSGEKTGKADATASEEQVVVNRFWTALTMGDEQERQAAWLAMLPNMTAANAAEVRDLFRRMDKQGRWFIPEWDVFWKRWGELDAAAALKDIEKVGPQYHPDLAEKILKGWAATGSAEARAWLESNKGSPSYSSALRGYLDGLARTNLDRATQDAITLGKGANMLRLAEVLAEQALRQRELGGMVDWWKTLPDDPNGGAIRREAIGHIYWRLQISSHDRAAEWLGQLASTPYRPDEQIGNLAERMAQGNPAKALEWVTSLPPSPTNGRYTAIGRSVSALAQRDPPAVETWLTELKPSPLRDQGLIAYATYLDRQSQADAAERWRAQVQDQQLLQPQLQNSIDQILQNARSIQQPK